MKKTTDESKTKLPYWLDKDVLNFLASTREEKTKGEEKFKYLISRDIKNLICPSIDDKFEKKSDRPYRRKLNKMLREKAILILDAEDFVKDILTFAKSNGLWEILYRLYPTDFYEYLSSPTIRAWDSRLKYLSLFNLRLNYKNDIRHFKDSYLPPKVEQKILEIMDNYGMEFFWYESLLHLILTGQWYLPRNSSVIHLKTSTKFKENICVDLFLQISSLTSKEEINHRWEEISSFKNQLFPTIGKRLKTRKNMEELFAYSFLGELGALAEKNTSSVKEYGSRLKSLHKNIMRARKNYRNFLVNNREVPRNLYNQMDVLNEWWMSDFYFF